MQMSSGENGAAVLATILAYYKKYVSLSDVRNECAVTRTNTSLPRLCEAAGNYGLDYTVYENLDAESVKSLHLPAVLVWNKYQYVILCGYGKDKFYIGDTERGYSTRSLQEFNKKFGGKAIVFTPGEHFEPAGQKPLPGINLLKRFKNYKTDCVLILLLQIISTVVATVAIGVNRRFVDDIIQKNNLDNKMILCIIMILLMVIRVVLSAASTFRILGTSKKIAARSESDLYKKFLHIPMSFFENHSIGDIMKRLNITAELDQPFLKTILTRIIDAAMVPIYLILLFYYNPTLAAICGGLEIIYILCSRIIINETRVISGSLNNSQAASAGITINMLNSIETIKAIGAERYFYSVWKKSEREQLINQHRYRRINSAGTLLSGIIEAVLVTVLMFLSVIFIIRGELTLGMLSSFQAVLTHMRSSLINAVNSAEKAESLSISADRVEDVMSRSDEDSVELTYEPDKLKGNISIRNLFFRYNKYDADVLSDISLDIKPGEFVALVGESGCGKSTLMKLISSLYKPDSGTILYDGQPRHEIADAVFHSSVAVVEQEPVPLHDTVESNLTLYDSFIENYEMVLATRDAQIYDRIISSDKGYQTIIAENGRNFSGGEAQRLELARALAQEPAILLLDEFTSALDAETEKKVFDALKARGSVTCILAAHRYSTVMSCDRVIVIKDGRITENGTPLELYEKGGDFSRLVNSH